MTLISLTVAFPSGDTKKITHPLGSDVLKCGMMKQLGHSIMRVKEDANKILTEAVNQEKSDQTRTQSVEMLSAKEDDNGDASEEDVGEDDEHLVEPLGKKMKTVSQ